MNAVRVRCYRNRHTPYVVPGERVLLSAGAGPNLIAHQKGLAIATPLQEDIAFAALPSP